MKNTTSFTLIEILIVTAIISVVTGLSLASYNKYTVKKDVQREAQMFADTLDLARKKALAAENLSYEGETTCLEDSGYEVTITGSLTYTLEKICNTENETLVTPIASYSLEKTQFVNINPPVEVLFMPLNQGIYVDSTTPILNTNFTVQSQQDSSEEVIITLSKDGVVYSVADTTFEELPTPTAGDVPTLLPTFIPKP